MFTGNNRVPSFGILIVRSWYREAAVFILEGVLMLVVAGGSSLHEIDLIRTNHFPSISLPRQKRYRRECGFSTHETFVEENSERKIEEEKNMRNQHEKLVIKS